MSKPVVAIVGRPNVGKSTLFNALAGEMISIVKDTPGVTRDRIYADVTWLDKEFTMIDTGGIEPDSKDIILSQMREQAQIAIDTADVIIFITDVKQGLVDAFSEKVVSDRKDMNFQIRKFLFYLFRHGAYIRICQLSCGNRQFFLPLVSCKAFIPFCKFFKKKTEHSDPIFQRSIISYTQMAGSHL